MKKLCYLATLILMILILFSTPVNAATGLEFQLQYTGEIKMDETKDAKVILRGTDVTTYPKVRVKVEVTGPSKPKIIAVDSTGKEVDIAQTGYWGPAEGFPIAGTFENITPVKATFNAAGTYKIKLSLVNVETGETEIFSKTETIEVLSTAQPPSTNTNTNVNENVTEELPKTGTSVMEYILYMGLFLIVVGFIYYKMNTVKKAEIK